MLKTVTLLAAITQVLALLAGILTFLRYAFRMGMSLDFLFTQPIHLLAEAVLAVFLFVLFSKQK